MTTYALPHTATQPPQHPMPSRRVSVTNQIKLLIAAAILGGPRLKAFSIHDATKQVGVALGQARYSTRFFVEAGLWDSIGSGVFAPSQAGRDFGMAWESSRDRARAVLADCFTRMWFHPTLQRELAGGPLPVEKLEAALLADGGGHQQHIKLLRSLLEWLSVAKLIEVGDDGMVAAGPLLAIDATTSTTSGTDETRPETEPETPAAQAADDPREDARVETEPQNRATVPAQRRASVLMELTYEAVSTLAPEEIPAFMKALAVLSQGKGESVLHHHF